MAFSFGNTSGAAMGGASANIQNGPDLEDVQTEALGFLALEGDAKVQLLPSPWPAENLPPPTASLMSVASQKGLVAAAGPDVVILATTESVRRAFEGPNLEGNIKPFQPQMVLPMRTRISQLAFSADETYLVLSAETGGGLAVYDVQALLGGSTAPAFEVSTNGQTLRALVPNPTPEKGELFAVVTSDGKLMMANLKERAFVTGPNGQVLRDGVSCISWSAKGKQLVAGLGDGTAYQITPEGVAKGDIPKPPGMDINHHISSITWLENNVFLMIYTPTSFDANMAPSSVFSIVTRQLPSSFQFQKITEPIGPFGVNRSPPHHFMLRLRDFPPNLKDLLIVGSSASADIGLFSRSETPLASNKPVGVFTMTELSDDSSRAQLPMSGMNDTSPIGFSLDLSSKEKVFKPIARDEMEWSLTPLPSLMVLNNEGVLASWWIVYSESVRQGTIYPNLVVAGGIQQSTVSQSTPAPAPAPAPAQPSPTPFGGTSTPSFSAISNPGPASGGVFGATSGIGQRTSVWSTTNTTAAGAASAASAFGKPAFGLASSTTPAFGTSAFGATSTPSFGNSGFATNKTSPWGTPAAANPAFGQATQSGKPSGLFGSAPPSTGPSVPTAGGFASHASKGGFAAAAAAPSGGIFSVKSNTSIFGSPAPTPEKNTASFGSSNTKFGEKSGGLFGGNGKGFVLGSTFKADTTARDETSSGGNESSLFGGQFGSALGEAGEKVTQQTTVSKDAEMISADEATKPVEFSQPSSMTPTSTTAPQKPIFTPSGVTGSAGIFGSTTPASVSSTNRPAASAGFGFGKNADQGSQPSAFSFSDLPSISTEKRPALAVPPPTLSETPQSPRIKEEPSLETRSGSPLDHIPEAPLPPDTTSKCTYNAGDTSVSSTGTDAPLPPDFVPKTNSKPITADMIPPSDVPGGPDEEADESDFESSEKGNREDEDPSSLGDDDDDGSGEDVAKDLSPTSETNQTPEVTPQSSFGGTQNRGTGNNFFTKIEKPYQPAHSGGLFGEVSSAHIFPPPQMQSSPRSPSPVRSAIPRRILRPEASRSVSAPGVASQILGSQKAPARPTFDLSMEQQKADEKRRADAKARKEEEEMRALVDDHDDRLQEILSSDLEPTTTLDEFVAHVEISGPSSIDSIPSQVETVYRDINSMIDTLGLNARALQCFIKGHEEHFKDEGRYKEDLENEEDWCLVEIENLSVIIEKDLGRELREGRVENVGEKVASCNSLQKEVMRLHARHDDIKKVLASRSDSKQLSVARSHPLSAEQAAQQHDLRRDFTKFQKLLSEAEEGLAVLKARIVSQSSSGNSNGTAGPTVEAVMRTITKMTSMAEKRSGDIDVLEGQMRKLRFSSTTSIGSREGSPFTTPNNRASIRNPGTSSTYGLFYTPDSIKDDRRGFQSSLMSSTSSFTRSSPPRKKMSGYTTDEKTQLKAKLARNKEVTGRLRTALKKAGTKVRLMDDDE